MNDFEQSLTQSVDIYRNPNPAGEPEYDDYGNEIVDTDKGNYTPVATAVRSLIVPLIGTRKAMDLKELGFKDMAHSYLMYAGFSNDIQTGDYIKKGDNYYMVFYLCDEVPEDHHKEFFVKKLSGVTLNT